jgi:hypothetical protein
MQRRGQSLALVLVVMAIQMVAATGWSVANDEHSLQLSGEAHEAVDAGVVLTFSAEYAERERWGVFTRTHQRHSHRLTLTRHALSNQYIVKVDDLGSPKLFRSITEAVNFISLRSHKLLDSYSTVETPFYMRISLNKYELPAPMRLKAFISDAWDIDTGWIKWTSVD